MAKKIHVKSVLAYKEDTLENWQEQNPVLHRGEVSVVRDGEDGLWLKIGDGTTPWKDLPYKPGPKGEKGEDAVTDQAYNPESQNAQSGKAVAEAFALKDFELLSDITLTEDTNEVCWTQTDSGETVKNYKDFFIYFLGSFTEEKSETMFCRANDGFQYFMYNIMPKKTSTLGFWILIESVANLENVNAISSTAYGGITIKKSTFPSTFLTDVAADKLLTQGLGGNARQINSDFSIYCLKRHATGQDFSQFENLYIGNTSTATSIFATGSRFLLFGRKA